VDRLLGEKGIPKDGLTDRREFERKWNGGEGWNWQRSLSRWSGVGVSGARPFVRNCWRRRASHSGAERQEIGKARAQRLAKEGLMGELDLCILPAE